MTNSFLAQWFVHILRISYHQCLLWPPTLIFTYLTYWLQNGRYRIGGYQYAICSILLCKYSNMKFNRIQNEQNWWLESEIAWTYWMKKLFYLTSLLQAWRTSWVAFWISDQRLTCVCAMTATHSSNTSLAFVYSMSSLHLQKHSNMKCKCIQNKRKLVIRE